MNIFDAIQTSAADLSSKNRQIIEAGMEIMFNV